MVKSTSDEKGEVKRQNWELICSLRVLLLYVASCIGTIDASQYLSKS